MPLCTRQLYRSSAMLRLTLLNGDLAQRFAADVGSMI
jgi:hypothetical protein